MGLFSNLFGSKKQTTTLEPMTDPAQQAARDFLEQLITSGSASGLDLGAPSGVSLGDFGIRPTESTALEGLASFVGGGTGDFDVARDVLNQFATSQFAPDTEAFKQALARETQGAEDILRREEARSGSRFSTAATESRRDLAAQQSEILAQELARQFENQQSRRFGAAQALPGLAQAQQSSELGRLTAGLQFGGFERALENQRVQAELQEFNRKREEELRRINIAGTLQGSNVSFGAKSIETKTPSLFSQLASPILGAVGTAAGGPIGSAIGSGIGNLFGGNNPNSVRDQSSLVNIASILGSR